MAETKTASQTQQKFVEDHLGRMQSMWAEVAKLEQKSLDEARRAIDEGARMMKETLAYGASLSEAWRAGVIDASRRVLEMRS